MYLENRDGKFLPCGPRGRRKLEESGFWPLIRAGWNEGKGREKERERGNYINITSNKYTYMAQMNTLYTMVNSVVHDCV